eukprot:TRINITY_DN14613_c0_g1_i1.p1 TRINITY_DN14613_c0_g1~~TRINITY_DN14613_c0_g1_i1.p1  ORF type:complete len:401 (-),score=115.30 TRINITY_DN14613_c0_g1_i1:19-1221(-)
MSGWGNAARGRGGATAASSSPSTEQKATPSWQTRHTNPAGSSGARPTSGGFGVASSPQQRSGSSTAGGFGVASSSPAPTATSGWGNRSSSGSARPPTSGWGARGGSVPQARRAADGQAVPGWAARNMAPEELQDQDGKPVDSDWTEQLKKAAEDFLMEHRIENDDPEETVMRMLALAQETTEIADSTNQELDRQVGVLKNQQQDMADIHDMLNRSEKDMTAIKSVWGGFKNVRNKKKDNQHQKLNAQWEKDFEDQKLEQERLNAKQWKVDEKQAWKQNRQVINDTVAAEKKNASAAKKESAQLQKSIKKGWASAPGQEDGQVMAEGFLWTARNDGVGEKCTAEQGLDRLEEYTSGFVDKALASQAAIRESQMRLDKVNSDMDRANHRIETLNDRGKRYAK